MSKTTYASNAPLGWGNWFKTLSVRAQRRIAALIMRRALRKAEGELMDLDARVLRDIGIADKEIHTILGRRTRQRVARSIWGIKLAQPF